ncbi:3-oxoacyl-[acyl-carrier-protein] synthase III C-terminal domain-containing protein [Lachnospiraceae bacterium 54-53]
MNSKISGMGSYFPGTVVSNDLLAEKFEIDPWLLKELGVETRFWASDPEDYTLNETQSEMMAKAIEEALLDSKVRKEDIDLLITSSTVPDYTLPTTATLVQELLEIKKCNAMEIHCGCVGALQAIDIAYSYIKCGKAKTAVIAAGNLMSTYWLRDWKNKEIQGMADQLNMAMFSDSASAIVIEASEEEGILFSFSESIGCGIEKGIFLDMGGAVYPGDQSDFAENRHKWNQKPRLIKKHGSTLSKHAMEKLAEGTGMSIEDLKWIIFPQANPSLLMKDIEGLRSKGFPVEKIRYNVNTAGNSATASLFHVLYEIERNGELADGDKIAIIGGGSL